MSNGKAKTFEWEGMGSSPKIDGREVKNCRSFKFEAEPNSIPALTMELNFHQHAVKIQDKIVLMYDRNTVSGACEVLRNAAVNDTYFASSFKDSIRSAIRDFHEGLPFEDDYKLTEAIFNRIFGLEDGK